MAEQESAPPGASVPAAEQSEFDFRGAYERSRNKRCTVAGVTLVGNTRTKDHIILRELPPVRLRHAARRQGPQLSTHLVSRQALLQGQTLDEIKDGLLDACDRLTALDAFASVDVLADKSAEARTPWQSVCEAR